MTCEYQNVPRLELLDEGCFAPLPCEVNLVIKRLKELLEEIAMTSTVQGIGLTLGSIWDDDTKLLYFGLAAGAVVVLLVICCLCTTIFR